MDLQQIKQDVDNGVFVTKATWLKVLEAAMVMQSGLNECADGGDNTHAMLRVLNRMEAL